MTEMDANSRLELMHNLLHRDKVKFYLYCAGSVAQSEKGQLCIELIQGWLDGYVTQEECKEALYAATRESGRAYDKDKTLIKHAFYRNAGGLNVTKEEDSLSAIYYAYIAAIHVGHYNQALKLQLLNYLEGLAGAAKEGENS